MKQCKECGTEFNHGNAKRKYCSTRCKNKSAARVFRSNNPDRVNELSKQTRLNRIKDFYVYMLPCGYVGQTNDLVDRMSKHKNKFGRDTEYVLLATCPTRDEARDIESLYQLITEQKVDDKSRLRPIL